MNIIIYSDEGVGKDSLKFAVEKFSKYGKVSLINHKEVALSDWHGCDLFVMPGGRDLPYCTLLNGEGCNSIRKYVKQGGVYFGICSGAYFGSANVEFSKDTSDEVVGSRELGFFPGTAVGPVYEGFDYDSYAGAKNIELDSAKGEYEVFYNGGCYFANADQYKNTKILATYDDGQAAIISCSYHGGKAILSGVHYEFPKGFLAG